MTAHILPVNAEKNNQDSYRDGRLTALINQCLSLQLKHLFLGHHLNDDVETLCFQLFRGATTNFRGIPSSSTIKNVQLHHPHLQLTKSYILAEMDKQNIPFVNDSSNQTLDYDRKKNSRLVSGCTP